MARPRIFISSTFYDLRQVRTDLDIFLENLGYEPIRNEEGDIPYGKTDALEHYCYREIQTVDILISVIGGRFGSESELEKSSISQIELKTALDEKKQVYIFIEKNVLAEYETYLLNKDNDVKYRFVDDVRIYQFIEKVKGLKINNNIKGFETSGDITKYLKEQFAGLFQRFLEQQTRTEEVNLIKELDRTAQNLDKLVTYLSEQNQGKQKDINSILMINHPLINALKKEISIPYNFYIEGLDDLNKLLKARGYIKQAYADGDKFYLWHKNQSKREETLEIKANLFDENGNLKYMTNNAWADDNVILVVEQIKQPKDDDLPF